ncbi:unnamed protein product [Adineta ricciae]|uniref:G-protein coupled receptors family 1 profile domain-containing protein n=1 Tax=Adineta ricciae TaxID=249248 RepID=A0A814ISG7_ADIRI|nr:unnamed protein product [Adineta ricciae]CAF1026581.1 unnamed protein product [Adineta ricciae]
MSNATVVSPSIDIVRLVTVILAMDNSMLVALYIIGMIGAILNMITFVQRQIRTNSCSIYFLSTAIIDFWIMNVFLLLEILTRFNLSLSPLIYKTRIWCKFGNFLLSILPCLSSTYLTLASVDRFCASSLNSTLRKCSQLKVSRNVVRVVFILWVLFELHIPIGYDYVFNSITNNTACQVTVGSPTVYLVIDGFFFALYNGAVVPFFLCTFGLLICYNMKRSRGRVAAQQTTRSNRTTVDPIPSTNQVRLVPTRNNFHMLTMLLMQVTVTIFLNVPYMAIYLYGYFNQPPKDLYQYALYIIFTFIARWFYYMNYCKTFYVNTLTSRLFRKSLQQQFLMLVRRRTISSVL